ncbi:MAG: VWA domain-containing protein [Tepidisphaeraceae bacterium]
MNCDVVIAIDLAREHAPTIDAVNGVGEEHFLAVTFVPEFDFDQLGVDRSASPETVFVLDCSGSMQGTSIEQAVRALELCLRSMNLGEKFNVIRFGSTFETLSSEPLSYDQRSLDRAVKWIARSADLGGTELMAPLQAMLATMSRDGRNIVLLTDGQVTNEPAIIELARLHRAGNRFFTFGIGPAVSMYLVNGLARVTGGASEFISGDERIEDKVLRLFSRLASPPVSDVQLDFGNADIERPATIPPIFDGDLVQVFARVVGKTLPRQVTLRGRLRQRRGMDD